MDRCGIAEALVYDAAAAGYDFEYGNGRLQEEIIDAGRLHACWVVLPHHTAEMQRPRMLVEGMLAGGVRAARMFQLATVSHCRIGAPMNCSKPMASIESQYFLTTTARTGRRTSWTTMQFSGFAKIFRRYLWFLFEKE